MITYYTTIHVHLFVTYIDEQRSMINVRFHQGKNSATFQGENPRREMLLILAVNSPLGYNYGGRKAEKYLKWKEKKNSRQGTYVRL